MSAFVRNVLILDQWLRDRLSVTVKLLGEERWIVRQKSLPRWR
jgi:hypothetical protein